MGLYKIPNWLILGCLVWSIATPAAAETKQTEIFLSAQGDQTFEALMQQAESSVRESLDRSFANPATTEVSVKVLGEREGQVAPLLYVQVSRDNWQKNSSVQPWARYFGGSTFLLGFGRRSPDLQVATVIPQSSTSENEPNFYDSK